MITLNNFSKQDIDISSLSGKQKIAYNFIKRHINLLGASQVVDNALNISIQTLNEPTQEPDKPTTKKPKQQTLTNPIDIFIHKAGSTFRGIPSNEIKALLTALERVRNEDEEEWAQFTEDNRLDFFNFKPSEMDILGLTPDISKKNEPKTDLLTTQNYSGELRLSETGEAILAAYNKFTGNKANLKPVSTGQLQLFGIDSTNEQFNKELDLLIQGKLPRNHVFKLGMPSKPLLIAGVNNINIELSASRLLTKSDKDYVNKHPFELSSLKNLPKSLITPLAVFSGKFGRKIVLTELKQGAHNFILAISLFNSKPGRTQDTEVNSLVTIFPKDNYKGLYKAIKYDLIWANKEKMLRFIQDHETNFHAVGIKAKHITNVIKNFAKPNRK